MRKIVDEHGKLLGYVNLLDLAIAVVLLVLGLKVMADYKPATTDFRFLQVTVGLLISNVPPYLADSMMVGQDVYQDNTGAYLGKINDIQTAPAEIVLPQNGRLQLVQSPQNLDVRIHLKNRGRKITGPAQAGIYLGKLAVRVGDCLKAHTLYTSLEGEVESLRVRSNGRR